MSIALKAQRANYLNKDINSVCGSTIKEYDMKSAGFSMIKAHNLLPNDQIDYLESISKDKKHLNIVIGKIRRDNSVFSDALSSAIRTSVTEFLIKNEVSESELLSIKNDAIFLVTKRPIKETKVNGATFILDNVFTSYYYINQIEFYFDSITSTLITKGLGGELIEKHKNSFLHELSYIFQEAEVRPFEDILELIKEFKNDYLTKALDINCYRELNRDNNFKFNFPNPLNHVIVMDSLEESALTDDHLKWLNINHNYLFFIVPLIQRLVN